MDGRTQYLEALVQRLLPALLTAAVVMAVLAAVAWGLTRWLRRLAPGSGGGEGAGSQGLARLIRRTLQALGLVVVALLVARGAGVGAPQLSWPQISDWVMGPGLRILFIFAGAFVLVRVTDFFIAHLEGILASSEGAAESPAMAGLERRKRIDTLGRLLRAVAVMVIVGMAMLMALREVNLDITPLLTGAGVAGVALGFGAQTVVKDLIAGVFLLLENQVRVGDVITINGKTGLVESIHLRIVVLRGTDGAVYIFQNGSISEYTNLTKDYSYAVVDLSVAYKEDLSRVRQVLESLGREMQQEPAYAAQILAPLEILGVDTLGGTSVDVKMRIKTRPVEQWSVGRELRRRIKERFEKEGITLS